MIQKTYLPSAVQSDVMSRLDDNLKIGEHFETHEFVGDFFNEDVFEALVARVDLHPIYLVDVESTQEEAGRTDTTMRATGDNVMITIYGCTSGSQSSTLLGGKGQISSADAAHATLAVLQGEKPDLAGEFDTADYQYSYSSMEREYVGGDVSVHGIRYILSLTIDVKSYQND